jgi:hypothetical protein
MLLAQYGEYAGLDRAFRLWREGGKQRAPKALLVGLQLTRDAKYLPVVRQALKEADDRWDLRRLLQPLRGMRGREARALRREINRRMRNMPR